MIFVLGLISFILLLLVNVVENNETSKLLISLNLLKLVLQSAVYYILNDYLFDLFDNSDRLFFNKYDDIDELLTLYGIDIGI